MNKFTPYIFPAVVVVIVFFLVFRWYSDRSRLTPDVGEGISIENLSEEELKNAISGVGDYKTIQLDETESSEPNEETLTGVVRYEIENDKVRLSVIAESGDPSVDYYVWMQLSGSTTPKRVFMLVANKGGLVGSGALSVDQLPLDVFVTRGETLDEQMKNVVLKGRVEADTAK
ncbi:MAG TPA: hypothetical protein PKJ26_02100 [Candidatus Woesebacteria bacterium]|nr:hypothetical protein [Candidatus Woesebacteria bacterium]HNS65267.1 hypothetical protein [Candidatus Woesebacteria bacterium]